MFTDTSTHVRGQLAGLRPSNRTYQMFGPFGKGSNTYTEEIHAKGTNFVKFRYIYNQTDET